MRALVATDATEPARVAVDLAAEMVWPASSSIELIRANPPPHNRLAAIWPTARHTLDDIVAEVRRDDAELIVIPGGGHLDRRTSVSQLVERARLPVLVARCGQLERVVFGWDGSSGAEHAAAFLLGSGLFADARIDVVSVAEARAPHWVDMGINASDPAARAYERAARPAATLHPRHARLMADRLGVAGLCAVAERRRGDPARALVAAATAERADLIVVGAHGRSRPCRARLGPVAGDVLHQAHCSVLVVPNEATAR